MSEQLRKQLQMLQQKFGFDRPYVSPAQSMSGALEGFSRAVANRSVQSVEIGEAVHTDAMGRQSQSYRPLITFTRSGPQEFANGAGAWWWDE